MKSFGLLLADGVHRPKTVRNVSAETLVEDRRKEIIDFVSESNLIIEPRAVEMLCKEDSYKNFIEE